MPGKREFPGMVRVLLARSIFSLRVEEGLFVPFRPD
jgi:hypothetical protein